MGGEERFGRGRSAESNSPTIPQLTDFDARQEILKKK